MSRELIKEVAQCFKDHSALIYEVGGSVRDELMGRLPKDFDFAVSTIPTFTVGILENFCKGRNDCSFYTVGMEYGTVGLAFKDGLKMEFTTFRKEVYPTNSRKPNVEWGSKIYDDLARRDFTINAIARDPLTGDFLDLFGGIIDIEDKVLHCIGSEARLDEDPLRMMRGIRFAVQFNFKVDFSITNPERITIISEERVRDELVKILLSPDPVRGINLLKDTGLIDFILPELMCLKGLEQGHNHIADALGHTLRVVMHSCAFEFEDDNLVFRLACLLHDIAKPVTYTEDKNGIHFYSHDEIGEQMTHQILERLKFDTDTINRVGTLVRRHMEPIILSVQGALNRRNIARLIRRLSSDTHYDIQLLLSLTECDVLSGAYPRPGFIRQLRNLVNECELILPKQICPVTGTEIMDLLHIGTGKLVGEIKDFALDLASEGKSKDEILKEIEEKYGNY